MTPTGRQSRALRIATRQSKLALWQAEHVASLLRAAQPGLEVLLVPMQTQGDRVLDRTLAAVGGKGLFVKELESALAEHRADIAVHSMKDVPTTLPEGMALAAMLPRADARDAFLSIDHPNFAALPVGARVGTSSPRRQCQLKQLRPDIEVVTLRGNVDTRIRRLEEGRYAAILLANAGLARLGATTHIRELMEVDRCVPAVGQGIIGIECRADDKQTRDLVVPLNHVQTEICLDAERSFARRLEGSCQSPIAGYAELTGDSVTLRGLVGSPDGQRIYRGTVTGPPSQAATLGIELANQLLAQGADRLLQELRST